jgi:sugar (pentulose or hexulose) kinase
MSMATLSAKHQIVIPREARESVRGIGLSVQMHGLVLLDEAVVKGIR